MRLKYSKGGAALIAAATAGALLLWAPVAAQAAHTSASAKAPSKGFFVTGAGRATSSPNPSAFLRDDAGRLHVVTTVRSASASGDRGRIVYSTKKPSATHWVTHAVPGLRPLAGGIQIEEHLSLAGNRIFAVFYECDGVYASEASLSATRLPEPSLVQSADNCATTTGTPKPGSPTVARAVPYYTFDGRGIALLLPDPANGNLPTIFAGAPGSTFTPLSVLPTTDGFTPVALSGDPSSYFVTVVGTGTNGTVRGIYATSDYIYESTWPAPTRIANLNSATSDFTIESVANVGVTAWVGLLKPRVNGVAPKHSLYLEHGTDLNGTPQWSGTLPLPHSTGLDSGLVLAINTTTNHPHAVFTRVTPGSKAKKSGVMLANKLANGSWSKPTFVTHWYLDHADQVSIGSNGGTFIGYDQR